MLTLALEQVELYAQAHSTKELELLSKLTKRTFIETSLPNMSVGHIGGAFLKLLVKILNAKRILEIGTFTGYSALAMAEGISDDGKIITLDIDTKNTEIAKQFFLLSPHGKKIKLIIGNANETIKTLEGPFDFVFIDAEKESYINYWELCLPKIRSGGLIVIDNVLWHGRVLNPKDEIEIAIDEFNKHVLTDNRVEVLMLTVRDGITLAYKK